MTVEKRADSYCIDVSCVAMSFLLDGRAPGEKWIKTEFGWKPLTELRKELSAHLISQLRQIRGKSGSSTFEYLSSKNDGSSHIMTRDEYLKYLQHALTNRSVFTGGLTSRESSRYSTISDAIQKLNLHVALKDNNYFPFICKVLCQIFENVYHNSSGSLQMTLLKLVEAALVQSLNIRMFGSLVCKTINTAISANQKVRQNQLSTFAVSNVDKKIKALLKMKQRLHESEQGTESNSDDGSHLFLLDLPDDCLMHIISFLSNPRDILNLQQTCMRLNILGTENQVWKSLVYYHYDQEIDEVAIVDSSWMDTFSAHYMKSGKKLKPEELSDVIVLCNICKFVFWKHYGHPCCGDSPAAQYLAGEHMFDFLTPQSFVSLFSY